jgi:putative transposase
MQSLIQTWDHSSDIQLFQIEQSKPNQNAYIELFNGRFCDECRNNYWCTSLPHSHVIAEA